VLADRHHAGDSVRAIALELGRSPSTVSRELRRNRDEASGRYRPFAAQRLAAQRRMRPRTGKLAADANLRKFVQGRLDQRWSPEQISLALPDEFPDQPDRHLVPETIYQARSTAPIWVLGCGATGVLRTGRLRRKPHGVPTLAGRGDWST
jgi:IS30 family transposase